MAILNLVNSLKYPEQSDLEKELMFEDVCPVWSEKLRKGLDRKDKRVLATDSKHCLVGEAWGFTGRQTGYYIALLIPLIGCWNCIKYGRKFGKIVKKDNCSFYHFEPLILEFLEHWNQKHKTVTKRRSKSGE